MTLDRDTVAAALATGDDSCITLLALLSTWYARMDAAERFDYASADPMTLQYVLGQDFGKVSAKSLAKINAALALLSNPDMWRLSLGYFSALVGGMNGNVANSPDDDSRRQTLVANDSDDILLAVAEAMLLLGGDYTDGYSPDIRHYVGGVLASEGFRLAPKMLTWAEYGKRDEAMALKRMERDGEFATQSEKIAVDGANALDHWLTTKLGKMMMRWEELGLAGEGDAWFADLSKGLLDEVRRLT